MVPPVLALLSAFVVCGVPFVPSDADSQSSSGGIGTTVAVAAFGAGR